MANDDRFKRAVSDVDSPAEFAYEIPENQNGTHSTPTRALYIGSAGNVYVRMVNTYVGATGEETLGANVLFQGVVAGKILPIRIQAVWADVVTPTATTANTGLIALY